MNWLVSFARQLRDRFCCVRFLFPLRRWVCQPRPVPRCSEAENTELSNPLAIEDADLEYLVTLGKTRDCIWFGSITRGTDRADLSPGPLIDVILQAKYRIEGRLPIILAVAEHRSSLRHGNIRLRVEKWTEIEAEELLILIDAKGGGYGLDLTGCKLQNIDLSHNWINERWEADPDKERNTSPRWKSSKTGGINLEGACLDDVSFWHVNLMHADLESTSLKGASLSSCDLQRSRMDRADLTGAHCSNTNFRRAMMLGANFTGAGMLRCELLEAELSNSDWRGATIRESRFTGAGLRTAHLEGVDLFSAEADSLSGVYWGSAFLDRTRIRREQLGNELAEETEARTGRRLLSNELDEGHEVYVLPLEFREDIYRQAREAYMTHKMNFASIGRYADASWAYQRERAMERGRLFRAFRPRRPTSWPNIGKWLVSWVECGLTGYGERPWRTTAAAIITIIVFALIFDTSNLITFYGAQSSAKVHDISFGDALLFSAATFLTAGIANTGPIDLASEWIEITESALGLGLFALLIFTLGNRISRS